jgi:type VI secretion system protein ImpM
MQCSLYGKLPVKRDFIAIGAPREFLNAWEPWLQGSVSASRSLLGEGWQNAFLTAPIWRFWLGADICGRTVIGAFMSSLDGVGRYFPLTLFAWAEGAIAPPELHPQDEWFQAVEDFLVWTLDPNTNFEAITAALAALAPPAEEIVLAPDAVATPVMIATDDAVAMSPDEQGFEAVFASMRRRDHCGVYSATSFWWTTGGDGFPPLALGARRMPDPFLFAAMLTGRFTADQS